MARKTIPLVVLLLAAMILAAGCAPATHRSPRAGPDWSRGVLLGEGSFNDIVGLYAEADGQRVHLAWGRVSPGGDHIRYLQLNARAAVTEDHALPFTVQSPRQVRLLPDGQGGLVVCWLSGVSRDRRLYAAHLDGSGRPLGQPQQVSGLDLETNEYVALSSASGVEILWSHNAWATRGIYHLQLDQAARVARPSRLAVEGGISPQAQLGADGLLHLTWIYEPGYFEENVYYAPFDPQRQDLGMPVRVGFFALSPKATRHGPVVALSKDQVCIFWSAEQLAASFGSAAGEAECRYVSFPYGGAAEAEEKVLRLPPTVRPTYEPAGGAYGYTQIALGDGGSSPLVYMPNAAPGQRDEAALAVAFETATRNRSLVQIGVVYLAQGGVKGYQVAGRGHALVLRPVLAADRDDQLHLAWLEPVGTNRYQVYYASTRQDVRAALGRLTRQDLVDTAMAVAWGLVQGLTLFPVAIIWLFVPFVWVMAYALITASSDLDRWGARVVLGVAIALYLFVKFVLMPAIPIGMAPFLDRVSPAVGEVIMLAVPLAILGVGLGVLRLYLKRTEYPSLPVAYLVFGATDAFLTFFLYAPTMYG